MGVTTHKDKNNQPQLGAGWLGFCGSRVLFIDVNHHEYQRHRQHRPHQRQRFFTLKFDRQKGDHGHLDEQ